MNAEIFNGLSGSSQHVLAHFLDNNLQSTVFKPDEKQGKKLAGIQDAIKAGYLFAKEMPLNLGVKVFSTHKLRQLYKF